MVSEQITNIKDFMNKLLIGTDFDIFHVTDIHITTFNTFHIDGHIMKDFYDKEEYESLGCPVISKWSDLKPLCYQIIKGHNTPLNFKIIFKMPDSIVIDIIDKNQLDIPYESINGFFLNIKYDNSSLSYVTGTSLNIFDPGREAEHAFDKFIFDFVNTHFE
ncbi:MAG: hypothetical protein K2M78_12645 [Lachnospiraceae bacterium]|nr:hypothetical protein [Lachnospiraceae bacterium]